MKVVFAGTPEFACVALRRLRGAGFDLPLVLTQPDRPAGRGMRLQPSAVKVFAREHGITLAQPRSLRLDGAFPENAAATRQALTDARAQVMVVAAYGLILPRWVLDFMHQPCGGAPALGCLNIHASLLPRWRGAAPIQRAIEAGDDRTGVTIMQMDAGLDTGDILLAQAIPVKHDGPRADTSGSLHDRLAALGGDLIVRALEQASQGRLEARKQPAEGASYASKVEKACARVDWEGSAQLLERRVRAFNPAPGAWTELGGEMLKVWRAEVAALQGGHGAPCGTVLRVEPDGIDVACGLGVLRLRELQRAGGKRLDVDAYLRGSALRPGMRFGVPPA